MNDWLKVAIPIAVTLIGTAFALNNRLAAIEKSVAVMEWRMDHQVGKAPWDKE